MLEMFVNGLEVEEEKEDVFYTYDSKEDILKCLNCTKEECNNCLKHKNFV